MMRGRRPVVIEVVAWRRPEAMRGRRGPVEILLAWRGRPSVIVGLCACPGRRKDEQGGAGEKCAHVVSRHAGPQGARDHMNERRALRFSRRSAAQTSMLSGVSASARGRSRKPGPASSGSRNEAPAASSTV